MNNLQEVVRILKESELEAELKMLIMDFLAREKNEEAKDDFVKLLIAWDKDDNSMEESMQKRLKEIEEEFQKSSKELNEQATESIDRLATEIDDAEKIASVKASLSKE